MRFAAGLLMAVLIGLTGCSSATVEDSGKASTAKSSTATPGTATSGSGPPASGKLVTALVEGGMRGWTVVDMKDDRNPVFSD